MLLSLGETRRKILPRVIKFPRIRLGTVFKKVSRMSRSNQTAAETGCLYLVATPIGNLEDITLRALRVLKEADLVACEDTRRTQKLLNHYSIRKRLVSYHEHNEMTRAPELLIEMEQGAKAALVSDAGTPAISDPGHRLVTLCLRHRIPVVPIPGPSALIAALAVSGMSTEEFVFVGFLPARARFGDRKSTRLNSSHLVISYAVFCLKKKKNKISPHDQSIRINLTFLE